MSRGKGAMDARESHVMVTVVTLEMIVAPQPFVTWM